MPAHIPSHLVSPDGIRVPIHGAVDAVNLRSRGYRDLTPHEDAQLAVELAEANLTHAQREGDSGRAVEDAERALARAREDAARLLQEMNDELAAANDSDRATTESVAAAATETASTPASPPAPEPETPPAAKAPRSSKPAGK